ncbi:MAG: GntR family transcriptional regulator, partial [Proteobacteria bacterium]|nr:GntR family transcriptional regulator [Pseudomonadota bacterium]
VYQTIRERLLYLDYKPGQILNEKVLAQEFGMSRSPIKDVLNRLEWDQLVRVIPRTGSMVTEIEFSKVMNIYQVRFEIEAFEARLAGDQFSSKHSSELKNLYENCTKLLDKKNCKALTGIDASLRDIIHDAAGNPVLAEVSDRLYSQTFRLWYTVLDKSDWREEVTAVINELEKLLNCFSGDNLKKLGEIRRNQLISHFERLRQKFLGTTDIPMP